MSSRTDNPKQYRIYSVCIPIAAARQEKTDSFSSSSFLADLPQHTKSGEAVVKKTDSAEYSVENSEGAVCALVQTIPEDTKKFHKRYSMASKKCQQECCRKHSVQPNRLFLLVWESSPEQELHVSSRLFLAAQEK